MTKVGTPVPHPVGDLFMVLPDAGRVTPRGLRTVGETKGGGMVPETTTESVVGRSGSGGEGRKSDETGGTF